MLKHSDQAHKDCDYTINILPSFQLSLSPSLSLHLQQKLVVHGHE